MINQTKEAKGKAKLTVDGPRHKLHSLGNHSKLPLRKVDPTISSTTGNIECQDDLEKLGRNDRHRLRPDISDPTNIASKTVKQRDGLNATSVVQSASMRSTPLVLAVEYRRRSMT